MSTTGAQSIILRIYIIYLIDMLVNKAAAYFSNFVFFS